MTKINCLNPIAAVGLDLLPESYEITKESGEADAVLVRSASMHDTPLSDSLLAVARAGAGVNNIPLTDCADKGIVVFNTPGANANGVKELAVAGMLLASRDIVGGVNWVRENKGDEGIAKTVESAKKAFAGTEIAGKKLGVIGLGAIGVPVANAANRLGMQVFGCDPYLSVVNALDMSRDIHIVKTREMIYEDCDFITIHVPLVDDTKEMINKESLAQMKDGVVILNFSRDSVVNDDDMAEALKSGKVAKYVTDFPNHKSANMENVIGIPHLGASTEESEDNCAVMAVRELVDYIEHGIIRNSVNYPECDPGACTTEGRITICHRNVPHMLKQFAGIPSKYGINIENMVNKSRGDYAYTLFDIVAPSNETMVKELEEIDGVLKVRIVK